MTLGGNMLCKSVLLLIHRFIWIFFKRQTVRMVRRLIACAIWLTGFKLSNSVRVPRVACYDYYHKTRGDWLGDTCLLYFITNNNIRLSAISYIILVMLKEIRYLTEHVNTWSCSVHHDYCISISSFYARKKYTK